MAAGSGPESARSDAERYRERRPSRDGIGRVYMGREIARVMGYQGAAWLERPTRRMEERTDLLIRALPLEEGDVVADIGAGTGYFSLPIARRVPRGRVLAVDLQAEMLSIVVRRADEAGLTNIEPVRATETDPGLAPSSVDLALFVDVYHEISHPYEVMRAVAEALEPDGVVVLVEYRAEDPSVPIKPLHKMTQRQAKKEMRAVGLEWLQTIDVLPQQHLMLFGKAPED
ncbi:MAG: class I SAM-dependent methyltransferase [Thermoanaerobaculia bacterium]|nr:class I SAM-dependent methyltransferase [Thermoanaerobaculia bacterium]